MKGQILVINEETQMGAIAMRDGQHELSHFTDWSDMLPPQAGMKVQVTLDADRKYTRQVQMCADFAQPTAAAHAPQATFAMAPKRKSALTLLTMFFGFVGGHRLCMGAWGWRLVQLLLMPALLVLFFAVVPELGMLIHLALGVSVFVALKDHQAKQPGAFSFFW